MLRRVLNELPTLVVLALTVAGVDQADYQPVIELAGAASGFGVWLLVRRRTDGPVTAAEQRQGGRPPPMTIDNPHGYRTP